MQVGMRDFVYFASLFHQEGLQAPELRDGAQEGEDPPVLEGN